MFQFELFPPRRAPVALAPYAPAGPRLSHRALLAWAEHCIECAPPACYSTCDLYDATPALKCRRFDDGIVSNRSGGPASAEIRFRKWAKLEAQGNVAMLPVRQVDRYEALLTRLAPPITHIGRIVSRFGGSRRWLTATEALHKKIGRRLERRGGQGRRPNLFVAEVTNPTNVSAAMILSVAVDKLRLSRSLPADQLPPPAFVRLDFPPGFSAIEVDVAPMRAIFESGLPFNLAIAPEDDMPVHLVFHRLDLGVSDVEGAHAPSLSASGDKAAKLVIFDLDNTLWRGILLEGDVVPVDGLHALFRTLDERGILLSVASKNAPDDAMRRLEEFGLSEFLIYPQIGWGPKSESVRRIVKAIDIGADTVLFVDDNPFERAEVVQAVPGVEALAETALAGLAGHPRLRGAATPEARTRRQMYREAIARNSSAATFGDDYLEFLRSCDIRIEIRDDKPEDFERIVELVQRTNQLNFSGQKYSREDTAKILADPERERHVIDCADRFGSYGTVGFALIRRIAIDTTADELVIDDFMLSCRVQGKFVEQAMLENIAGRGARDVRSIRVNFHKTERNKAAQMVLEKLGFELEDTGTGYRRRYAPGDFAVDFMSVRGG
jgi:FkbH-like protein